METELQKALKLYLANNPGSERELADELRVSIDTLKLWLKGTNLPHLEIARVIIDYLKSKS